MSRISRNLFVVNPAGRGGSGLEVWERITRVRGHAIDVTEVRFTAGQGHAEEITAGASGYDIVTAVGGDGTVGEVMTGIMAHQGPRPKLAIVPAGTGNDIARNLAITTFSQALRALDEKQVRRVDLARIDCQVEGESGHRYAFLGATLGFTPMRAVRPWMKRLLGPKGAYYLATILEIIVYRPPQMTVRWGDEKHEGRVVLVLVGNVERTAGGSMCVAPGALFDDGKLNVTIVPIRSRFDMLTRALPKVPSGEHIQEPGVRYFPATEIEVLSEPSSTVEIDGDLFGETPARISVCPQAIEVICPGGTESGDR